MQQETMNGSNDNNIVVDSILIKVYFYPGDIVRKIRVPVTTTFSEFSDMIRQLVEEQESSLWVKGTSTKLSCCVCGDDQETEWFNLSNEVQWQNVLDVTRLLNETRLVVPAVSVGDDEKYPDHGAERFLRVRAVGVLAGVVPLSASYFAPLVGNLQRLKASWSEKLQLANWINDEPEEDDEVDREGKFVLLDDLDPTFFVPDDETLNHEQPQQVVDRRRQEEQNVDNIVMNDPHDTDCSTQLSSSYSTCTTPMSETIEFGDAQEEEEEQQQELFKYDKELDLLKQMGIPDSESVRQLLVENDGNLPRVVSAYLQVSFM